MKLINTQPEFGESGPFEEPSIEHALDAMQISFEVWAQEAWERVLDEWADEDVEEISKEDFIANHISENREKYRRGLEIVEG